ncbi:hypothetical protein [Streptomyces sp. NPDC050560]|uniref:hypothetical protein n=1 Tax=Streptomyces sp. NPDC050560 TaxID=3365630 RepID=UPI0037B0377A
MEMISTRAKPHLLPGERVQTGFIAQTGAMLFRTTVWTIIATDRAILVVRRGEALRLGRDVVFGTPTGLYHEIHLDRAYKVHRDYYKEIAQADEALHEMRSQDAPPPAAPSPDAPPPYAPPPGD